MGNSVEITRKARETLSKKFKKKDLDEINNL